MCFLEANQEILIPAFMHIQKKEAFITKLVDDDEDDDELLSPYECHAREGKVMELPGKEQQHSV